MNRLQIKQIQPYVCCMIRCYLGVPLALVNPMAICLPYLEAFAGLMLLVGFRTRAAALTIVGMMFMFLVAVIMALAKGLHTSCGCFASQAAASDPIGWLTVVRDLVWLGLAVDVVVFDRKPFGLDSWLFNSLSAHKEGKQP